MCVVLLGGILLVLGALRHKALESVLMALEREDVTAKVQQVQDYIGDLAQEAIVERMPMDVRPRVLLPDAMSADGMYVQLVGTDGRVWAKSGNLGDLVLPYTQKPGFSTIELPVAHLRGPRKFLMLSRSLAIVGVPITTIEVADSLKPIQTTMDQQLTINVASEIVGLFMAAIAGFYLATWTLRPIERLTAQVNDIEAKDLRRRVNTLGLANDEIGQLAATFNRLLARLEQAFAAQQRFVADASHELRTPLTAIAGHAQLLLKRGRSDPSLFEVPLQTILKETDRLTRLV
ncbi:MAG: HAMP domain-containing protein, partial [Cyanobacteria bacterium REEB65]|nr:HAMP domain-containing protein [Cyanobacteria bacterium REEB65]